MIECVMAHGIGLIKQSEKTFKTYMRIDQGYMQEYIMSKTKL